MVYYGTAETQIIKAANRIKDQKWKFARKHERYFEKMKKSSYTVYFMQSIKLKVFIRLDYNYLTRKKLHSFSKIKICFLNVLWLWRKTSTEFECKYFSYGKKIKRSPHLNSLYFLDKKQI